MSDTDTKKVIRNCIRKCCAGGRIRAPGVAEGETILANSIVFMNPDGFSTNDPAGAKKVVGIAICEADNSCGLDGDTDLEVYSKHQFGQFPLDMPAERGACGILYAVDECTVSFTDTGLPIGPFVEFVDDEPGSCVMVEMCCGSAAAATGGAPAQEEEGEAERPEPPTPDNGEGETPDENRG